VNAVEALVVILCRDTGRTLDRALQSVRSQSSPAGDLLIIDHGSSDLYTRQVLSRLEREGTRVQVTPDRSASAALQAGIASTPALYVVVLNADSTLEPTFLECSIKLLEETPSLGFVVTSDDEHFPAGPVDFVSLMTVGNACEGVFRRQAWVESGGPTRLHDDLLDLLLSFAEHGYAGTALPRSAQPSVGDRRQPGDTDSHLAALQRVVTKHAPSMNRHAEALLLSREAVILAERSRTQLLQQERSRSAVELEELEREIASMVQSLQERGRPRVEFGDLRRTSPISPVWGTDRGLPVDRYYIESFLNAHRVDVKGRVLEVKDPGYTRMFGDDRVTQADVVDVDASNKRATIVADLVDARGIATNSFDCFILTQTLGLIYDVRAALATAHRILKPGGVLLCTLPAAGRLSYEGPALDGDYWRFTEASVRRLFAEVFQVSNFEVTGFGNVLTSIAFTHGLAHHELSVEELDVADPFFPIVYGVKATKP